jgi:hypothetical protein
MIQPLSQNSGIMPVWLDLLRSCFGSEPFLQLPCRCALGGPVQGPEQYFQTDPLPNRAYFERLVSRKYDARRETTIEPADVKL